MRYQLAVLVSVSFLSAPAAFAQDPPPAEAEGDAPLAVDGKTLIVRTDDGAVETELPCEPSSWATQDDLLYAVCDDLGLLVVSLEDPSSPEPLEVRRPEPPEKVLQVGGRVWLQTASGVRPITDEPSLAEPTPPPEPPEAVERPPAEEEPEEVEAPAPVEEERPELPVGQVVATHPAHAIIDVGTDDGLEEDVRIEFYTVESLDLGGGQVVEQDRQLSVGVIDSVSASRARVKLGLNERVDVGAKARPTTLAETDNFWSPRRVGGHWEASFLARPFLALGTIGGGAIIDALLAYRFDAPFAVDFFVSPLGFGLAEAGNVFSFAANLVGSFDTTAFQVGLGAGASQINTLFGSGSGFVAADSEPTYTVAFSAAQFVRLGSRDGIHLKVLNNFVLFEDEFEFGGITAEGFIPLRVIVDHAWLIGRGGGGVPGHAFGELGLKLLARGNGGPGSLFLTTTVGGGILTTSEFEACTGWQDPVSGEFYEGEPPDFRNGDASAVDGYCRQERTYGGPLVGFGMEWRF